MSRERFRTKKHYEYIDMIGIVNSELVIGFWLELSNKAI